MRRDKTWESEKQKLLGILIDRNLCFEECNFITMQKSWLKAEQAHYNLQIHDS